MKPREREASRLKYVESMPGDQSENAQASFRRGPHNNVRAMYSTLHCAARVVCCVCCCGEEDGGEGGLQRRP